MSKNRNRHNETETPVNSTETQVTETTNEVREPQVLEDLTQSEGNLALKTEEVTKAYDDVALRAMTTKAAQIRYLHSAGLKRGEIAKILSEVHGKKVLYQHVRNVLVQVQKKAS
jgi:hypothetical protein